MKYTKILGTGSYLPENILTNKDLESRVDTSDQWIVERTGIRERRIVSEHESAYTMAVAAGQRALMAADIPASAIGLIIVATATPEHAFPSCACRVQHELGAQNAAAFDVSAACSGFVYALDIADQYIKSGAVQYALLIGSEALSRIVDWSDRGTCILFGDGAGAVVVGASESPGLLTSKIAADGQYHELLYANHPQNMPPALADHCFVRMKGNDVFKVAVRTLSALVGELLEQAGAQQSDIDWLIPHQANIRIIQAAAKKLSLPMEQVVVTVHDHGNTSGASIPLALDQAVRDGRVKRGDTLLLEAFGGGFVWGGALIVY